MAHNLDRYLQEVAQRLEGFPRNVVICWAEAKQLGGPGCGFWAMCHRPNRKRPAWVIGIDKALKRAPKYVLRYLVLHECLHVVIPWRPTPHSKRFRQAERAHPDFLRANAWLDAHT